MNHFRLTFFQAPQSALDVALAEIDRVSIASRSILMGRASYVDDAIEQTLAKLANAKRLGDSVSLAAQLDRLSGFEFRQRMLNPIDRFAQLDGLCR